MADPLSSFSGVSSGMDWKTLVDQIIKSDHVPADKMQAQIDKNTARKAGLSTLESSLNAMQSAADALTGTTSLASLLSGSTLTSPFDSYAVTATGTDASGRNVVSATTSGTAAPGTYAVHVTSLAAAQKLTAATGLKPTDTLGATYAGSLTIAKTGGTPTIPPIALDGTETLSQLRDKINALNTGATPSGVVASLVNVSATDQRLVLTSAQSGQANGFTLGDGGSGLLAHLGMDDASFTANPTLKQDAADAQFTVDGLSMSRATNSVSDVVSGVTLNLSAKGDSVVTVAQQTTGASDAMKAFVDAYNKAVTFISSQSKDVTQPLYNDQFVRNMRSSLATMTVTGSTPASKPGGAAGVADDLTTLSSIGVSLQKDGTLSFDASKFQATAGSRLADVKALLADKLGQFSKYADGVAHPVIGDIGQRNSAIDAQSLRLQSRIATIESRLDKKKAALTAQYSAFEGSLGKIKSLGDAMTAQFAGLNNSKSS